MSFYVTVRESASPTARWGRLVGPFVEHGEALEWVDAARRAALTVDPEAHWYFYGTAEVATTLPGKLNRLVGYVPEARP
ncbi:MAG TPA: hypothetical protein VL652_23185 [Kutzneria sp.]|nr:hypothetical protein [Kutzneria sp.]